MVTVRAVNFSDAPFHIVIITNVGFSRLLLPFCLAALLLVFNSTVPWLSYTLACHLRCPGSIPVQPMWDLWWTTLHWDMFVPEYFGFPLSVSFHQCSIFFFVYVLVLPEVNTSEAWKPSKKKQCSFENRRISIRKYFHIFSLERVRVLTAFCRKRPIPLDP